MYCGDETGAFIGDVASHVSRFGYGGNDSPSMVVPSFVGGTKSQQHLVSSCLRYRDHVRPIYRMNQEPQQQQQQNGGPNVDPIHFLQQGDIVDDWDAYEHMWQASFTALHVRDSAQHSQGSPLTESSSLPLKDNIEHPLLAVIPGMTHIMGVGPSYDKAIQRDQIVRHTELMMEALNAQAIFVAPSPMLAAFAHGRQTCTIVDIGAGGTRVTPVVDGHILRHAQRRSGRGGDWLGHVAWKAMLEDGISVTPRYQLKQNTSTSHTREQATTTESVLAFHQWSMRDVQYEFRTMCELVGLASYRTDAYTTPFLYADNRMDEDSELKNNGKEPTYELPDGTLIDLSTRIGKDLCRIPELLFTEDVPMVEEESSLLDQHPTLSNAPLHKLIHAALTAVGDVDARKELVGNLVLTGSSSLFPKMEQRLSYELGGIVTGNYKPRLLASRNAVERTCSAWLGASVLTSLGSFQQLWLSKAEYEEYGATLATQRFP